MQASDSEIIELLRLCLDANSILVFDGIDECDDSEKFVSLMLDIWKESRPRVVFLSRINVEGLKRSIPAGNQMAMSRVSLSKDIQKFSEAELGILFDQAILPQDDRHRQEDLVRIMVHGADGMFLWARLMINFIQSSSMSPKQRLHVIMEVSTPEGLEPMYERIVRFISTSGNQSMQLAAKLLDHLLHATVQLSSRQLRQALIADGFLPQQTASEPIHEFENAALMACAGLTERITMSQCPQFLLGESTLRLIHLSAREILEARHAWPSITTQQHQSWPPGQLQPKLILDRKGAHLEIATRCVQQLLSHTPHQPLSGRLHQDISAQHLYEVSCFTDYAAAAWIDHVSNVVNTSHDPGYPRYTSSLIFQFYSHEFLNLLSRFITNLTAWLKTPAALSAWLEAFYSTQYHEDYEHPKHQILDLLSMWLGEVSQQHRWLPMAAELPRDIISFSSELRHITQTWKHRLKESPGSIIWDEMTGFLQRSSFFYLPGSVKVMYQTVLSPHGAIPSSKPTLQMAKTSDSGDFKGVLSIWAPP